MTLGPKIAVLVMAAEMLCLPGCQPAAPAPKLSTVLEEEFDPCSERLRSLQEDLLLYYAKHRELPQKLTDLGSKMPVVCPTTKRPYAYAPDGVELPDRPWYVIVYEAVPCRGRGCWAILAKPFGPGKPLVLDVIQVPEALLPPPHLPTSRPASRSASPTAS